MTSSDGKSIASPLSTGGAGPYFEMYVGAYFLGLLATRSLLPILSDSVADRVTFQANLGGWQTDDLVVAGVDAEGRVGKLAIQVKRQFAVSSSNEECKKAIEDFWRDFNNSELFNPSRDRLVLIVAKGTKLLLSDFCSLLDCARASSDGNDFAKRVTKPGVISSKARSYKEAILSILNSIHDTETISDGALRRFLAAIYLLPLDLASSSGSSEADVKRLLMLTSNGSNPMEDANRSWAELVQLLSHEGSGSPSAASYSISELPAEITKRHSASIEFSSVSKFEAHGRLVLDRIKCELTNGMVIDRVELLAKAAEKLNRDSSLLISGASGTGKSAAAKQVLNQIRDHTFCIAFRAEEFANVHLDNVFSSIAPGMSPGRLFTLLASQESVVLMIDSLERLLEAQHREAFVDLIGLAGKLPNIKLVMTCRDYATETVRVNLLSDYLKAYETIKVSPLTDAELDEVSEKDANLGTALRNPKLRELFRNPYFLNMASHIAWGQVNEPDRYSEELFRRDCWQQVIRKDSSTAQGINLARGNAFIQLAVRRAQAMRPFVGCAVADMAAI